MDHLPIDAVTNAQCAMEFWNVRFLPFFSDPTEESYDIFLTLKTRENDIMEILMLIARFFNFRKNDIKIFHH